MQIKTIFLPAGTEFTDKGDIEPVFPEVDPKEPKYDADVSSSPLKLYIFIQFVTSVVVAMVAQEGWLGPSWSIILISFEFLSLATLGWIFEKKDFALTLELMRLLFTGVAIGVILYNFWQQSWWVFAGPMGAEVFFFLWFYPMFNSQLQSAKNEAQKTKNEQSVPANLLAEIF